ncbi:hypothetical protein PUN28_010739 [Cardiocondyla obscurior]|uniref:Uncharacterized protein n=1 Tax=Cardiocondyla obscurior TaxID=286306 RepID=A0AAW2FHW2_9HYME
MRAAVFTVAKFALTYYYPVGVFMTIASRVRITDWDVRIRPHCRDAIENRVLIRRPPCDSSFNRAATKYCRYVISRRKINYHGAFIASAESLHHFINPVGIENSSHSRQKLPLFPDSRDDSPGIKKKEERRKKKKEEKKKREVSSCNFRFDSPTRRCE